MYMKDWTSKLDEILQLNGRELLTHAGKISHEMAIEKSNQEFDKFSEAQKNYLLKTVLKSWKTI